MALSKLDSLYMAVVADHSKNPHHQGKLDDAEQISLNNPTCGDVINLSVKFDAEDRLEDIAFLNSGCTISTASASMMTDAVLGKTKIFYLLSGPVASSAARLALSLFIGKAVYPLLAAALPGMIFTALTSGLFASVLEKTLTLTKRVYERS